MAKNYCLRWGAEEFFKDNIEVHNIGEKVI
jgi:hypothetical protein